MTEKEIRQIAEVVASMITKPSEKPKKGSRSRSRVKDVPLIKTELTEPLEAHTASLTPHQVADMLNDVRLEVRIPREYPLVVALKEAMKQNKTINARTMKQIVETLKAKGKYWPQAVVMITNEKGERVFMNSSFTRDDDHKWKPGSVVKSL